MQKVAAMPFNDFLKSVQEEAGKLVNNAKYGIGLVIQAGIDAGKRVADWKVW